MLAVDLYLAHKIRSYAEEECSMLIERSLEEFHPSTIITVTCMDYRVQRRRGFLLTSAGNIVHPTMLADIHLILPGKKAILLQAHTDCQKTKSEVARIRGESEEAYQARVEQRTMERLWENARVLMNDQLIAKAIENGMLFCASLFDVNARKVTYFEKESRSLYDLRNCA